MGFFVDFFDKSCYTKFNEFENIMSNIQQSATDLPPVDIRINRLVQNLKFFDIDVLNPRWKQKLQDIVLYDIIGCEPPPPESTDVWLTITERAEELGYSFSLVALNELSLQVYIDAHSDEMNLKVKQQKRLYNGIQHLITLYRVCDDLDYLILEYLEAKVLSSN